MTPSDLDYSPAPADDPFAPASTGGFVAAEPRKQITVAPLRQLLHGLLGHAHEDAIEQLSDETGKDSARPVRAAVYLSIRRLKMEEENLRYKTVGTLVETIAEAFCGGGRDDADHSDRLSLMTEAELEDSVLVLTLSAAADTHSAHARSLLLTGLRAKLQCDDLARIDHALSPRGFLDVYFENIKALDLEPEPRVALLRCFQHHVLSDLTDVYDLLADQFDLRLATARAGGRTAASQVHGAAPSNQAGDARFAQEAMSEGVAGDVVSKLLEALAGRARESRGPTAVAWPRDRVLACLKRLQKCISDDLGEFKLGNGGLSAYLESELQRIFAEDLNASARRMSEADTATADLVDMVFDYLIDSQAGLSKERGAVLSTLRVPYLRVALLDRQLFVKRGHPARRLLEKLSTAEVAQPGADAEASTSLVGLVQRIHREFDGAAEYFDRLYQEQDRVNTASNRRLELAERRLVQLAEGKERLAEAWRDAIVFVRGLIVDTSPPRLIRDFLERPWAQYLVLHRLRQLRQKEGRVDPKQTAQELCDLCLPPADATSRIQLDASRRLTTLAKHIRAGMLEVGYAPEEVVGVWRDFVTVVVLKARLAHVRLQRFECIKPIGHSVDSAQRDLAHRGSIDTHADRPVEAPPVGEATRTAGVDETVRPPTATIALIPVSHDLVEGAALGQWYVEHVPGEEPRRHKLMWFGRFIGRYLFVDNAGRKTIECDGGAFVEMLESGRLKAVNETPRVDSVLATLFKTVVNP